MKVQPRLSISQPDDPSADRAADQVMGVANPIAGGSLHSFGSSVSPRAQRKCPTCREEEEEKLQRKGLDAAGSTQPKCAACEEEEERELQRKAEGAPANSLPVAPPIVVEALNSPGHTLDPATRSFMEERFGYDFGQVRLHTDEKAAESASALNAHAYTLGRDVFFGSGKYAPSATEGRRLLAHELAHVMQQRAVGTATDNHQTTQRLIQRQGRHHQGPTRSATMAGRRLGRMNIRLANRTEALSSELTVQSEVLPPDTIEASFTGYADETQAVSAARGRSTIMAIVRLGTGRYRVVDTGRMPESFGPSLSATSIQVTVYSSHDYEFVRWVNLNTQPQNLPEPPDNPMPIRGRERPLLGAPRDVYGYPDDELTSALRLFRQSNNRSLSDSQRSTVVEAIFAITTSNASLRLGLFNYYAAHPLSVGNIRELMRTSSGSTTINPRIFDASEGFTSERIGGLLVHEFRHTGATSRFMDITGDPVEEGRAYGIEYFFAEQRHDMVRQRGIGQVVLTGANEIEERTLPTFGAEFRLSYIVMVILHQLIEERFNDPQAPFMRPTAILPGEARGLVTEFIQSRSYSRRLEQVLEYARSNLTRFTTPRFNRDTFTPQ